MPHASPTPTSGILFRDTTFPVESGGCRFEHGPQSRMFEICVGRKSSGSIPALACQFIDEALPRSYSRSQPWR